MTISKFHYKHQKERFSSLWSVPLILIPLFGVNAHQALTHFSPVKRNNEALTQTSVNALNHSVTGLKPVYGITPYNGVIIITRNNNIGGGK